MSEDLWIWIGFGLPLQNEVYLGNAAVGPVLVLGRQLRCCCLRYALSPLDGAKRYTTSPLLNRVGSS